MCAPPLLDFYSSYMWFIQVSRECWTAHLNYRLSRFYKRKSNRLWRMLCSVGDGHDGSLSSLRYIFRCRGTEITVREGSKREKKSIVGVNGLRMILSLTFSF